MESLTPLQIYKQFEEQLNSTRSKPGLLILLLSPWHQSWPAQRSTSLLLHPELFWTLFCRVNFQQLDLCWEERLEVREGLDSLSLNGSFVIEAGPRFFFSSFSTSCRCFSIALNSFLSEGVAPSIFLRTCIAVISVQVYRPPTCIFSALALGS